VRLDQALVAGGLAASRERARQMILAGQVELAGKIATKAGVDLADPATIRLLVPDHPWVSRGALKLLGALEVFGIDPTGARALDIGASTGGFTEVLLARGAEAVLALDVGQGQLAEKLRTDPRVEALDQTNARDLTADHLARLGPPTWIVCDASFISLTLVLPAALALAAPGCTLIALIKPQFEVGRGNLGKGGIVRDVAQHEAVCAKIQAWLSEGQGWIVTGLAPSPIDGPDGNREFLIAARKF
jgi:23S rRNA (cytidine1920-2'-O)/16S rRNA (cytidine1409-2'-O)-methyltransferase